MNKYINMCERLLKTEHQLSIHWKYSTHNFLQSVASRHLFCTPGLCKGLPALTNPGFLITIHTSQTNTWLFACPAQEPIKQVGYCLMNIVEQTKDTDDISFFQSYWLASKEKSLHNWMIKFLCVCWIKKKESLYYNISNMWLISQYSRGSVVVNLCFCSLVAPKQPMQVKIEYFSIVLLINLLA